ncbi:prepilin-type N-terminal cleavage/methylation domain-containing protein [Candidatus Kaiserbacteria bacterium]|nr:MAG: prepilin-type N-terminal cleavage/methylation domain-containing protein [Candidatus Kaiserbacteria bacterium]
MNNKRTCAGITLIEVIVATTIFLMIALALYETFSTVVRVALVSQNKVTATALANEQMEIIRNLSYEDVGIQGGLPNGSIPHIQTLTRDGVEFTVTTVIRNIDDPFDGQIGSSTKNDLSPSDYRLAELTIDCAFCKDFAPMSFTSHIGPRGLETSSTNGALFIHVFDAAGQAIQGADVHIENNVATTSIVIDDTTNNDGYVQIIDAPPGINAYEISVSKPGYSSERTYMIGDVANPNPSKPHATVVSQQLSQVSFSIDTVSEFEVTSMTDTCTPVGNIDFSLTGEKIIGTTPPDVIKFSQAYSTNGGGLETVPDLEWDTYHLDVADVTYDLGGTIPSLPFTLNPDTHQNISLIVVPKNPRTLLVTVKDVGTGLPISGATVRLQKSGYDVTNITGRGYMSQTDWSGGDGQSMYTNATEYFEDDTDIENINPVGQVQLKETFGAFAGNGTLTSSTFDTGTSSAFKQILLQPQSQPPETGADSVRIQVATNNDMTTWDFKGPDGTLGTYYDVTNTDIHAVHTGDRYIRYKLFLATASSTWTPTVSDVAFTFTSNCTPPGQVLFTGIGAGTYTLTVTSSGYQVYTKSITVSNNWTHEEVLLLP